MSSSSKERELSVFVGFVLLARHGVSLLNAADIVASGQSFNFIQASRSPGFCSVFREIDAPVRSANDFALFTFSMCILLACTVWQLATGVDISGLIDMRAVGLLGVVAADLTGVCMVSLLDDLFARLPFGLIVCLGVW